MVTVVLPILFVKDVEVDKLMRIHQISNTNVNGKELVT
jgi:hypothetical protein